MDLGHHIWQHKTFGSTSRSRRWTEGRVVDAVLQRRIKRRTVMGKSMILVAMLIGLGISVSAQWQNVPRPVVPRLPDGRPNLTALAPRRADGKPDLSGVWNPAAGFIRDLGRDLKEPVPFQPWAK